VTFGEKAIFPGGTAELVSVLFVASYSLRISGSLPLSYAARFPFPSLLFRQPFRIVKDLGPNGVRKDFRYWAGQKWAIMRFFGVEFETRKAAQEYLDANRAVIEAAPVLSCRPAHAN
jgi:hypothetical protein